MKRSKKKPVPRGRTIYGWHWLDRTGCLSHEPKKRKVVVGKRLSVKGKLRICDRGLHASSTPGEAYSYASNLGVPAILTLVKVTGVLSRNIHFHGRFAADGVYHYSDKFCGRSRVALWMSKPKAMTLRPNASYERLAKKALGRRYPKHVGLNY